MRKPTGGRGTRGNRGAPGDQGSRGDRASRGDQGARGDRGSQSYRGPQSDRGSREGAGQRENREPRDNRATREGREGGAARAKPEEAEKKRSNRKPRRPWEAQPKRAVKPRPQPIATPPVENEPPESRTAPAAARARSDARPARPAGRAPRSASPTRRPARGTEQPESAEARQRVATYKLLIEYEGTRYSGWQEQKNAPTVMGSLRRAIEEAGLPIVEMGGAGRTDAGVHALQQCAHLRLEQRFDPAELCRALNKRLPKDVHVLGATPAEASFHARHDAVARSYLYQISRRRTALAKPWVWWVRDSIHVERLRTTAALCVGRHDFRNFADVDAGSKDSTLVEVESVEVIEEGALILVRIVASHFLWRMVRRLIGTLTQVATGNLAPGAFAKLLAGAPPGPDDPRPAEWTAPPSGLFLERVLYAGDPPLDRPIAVVRVAAEPPAVKNPPLRDTPR